jgi:hypothetical protein
MPISQRLCAIAIAALYSSLASCTTLDIDDRYALVEGDNEYDLTRTHQPYGVWIDPDTRLSSIGMLGVPLIPGKARTGEQKEFSVSVWLNSNRVRDFSFLAAPCLQAQDGNRLCPYEVEIANFTQATIPLSETDGERRLREMMPVKRIKNLVIPLYGAMQPEQRIDRQRIYQHFKLEMAAQWECFSVDLTYGNTEQVPPGLVQWSRVRSEFGLAPAESITCAMDDSALRASPFGPAAPFCLRQSRAAHPCAAATLTFSALPYRYRCGGTCPTRLSVERTGLIEVDGRSALEATVVFEKVRVRDYQPFVELQ